MDSYAGIRVLQIFSVANPIRSQHDLVPTFGPQIPGQGEITSHGIPGGVDKPAVDIRGQLASGYRAIGEHGRRNGIAGNGCRIQCIRNGN